MKVVLPSLVPGSLLTLGHVGGDGGRGQLEAASPAQGGALEQLAKKSALHRLKIFFFAEKSGGWWGLCFSIKVLIMNLKLPHGHVSHLEPPVDRALHDPVPAPGHLRVRPQPLLGAGGGGGGDGDGDEQEGEEDDTWHRRDHCSSSTGENWIISTSFAPINTFKSNLFFTASIAVLQLRCSCWCYCLAMQLRNSYIVRNRCNVVPFVPHFHV